MIKTYVPSPGGRGCILLNLAYGESSTAMILPGKEGGGFSSQPSDPFYFLGGSGSWEAIPAM